MKNFFIAALLMIVGLLFLGAGARAQNATTELRFSVSPAIVELAGNPGDVLEGSINFSNGGSTAVAGFLDVDPLVPIDNIVDQARRSEFDASSWIDIPSETAAFDAGTRVTVPFVVSIPEQANPGSHYALLTLRPGAIDSLVTDTVVAPELSASIFITVSGDIVEKAEIAEEDLRISHVTTGSTKELSFRIRNTGNVHILPAPRLSILKDGERIEIFALQPQLILPNTEKTFNVTWEADVGIGQYAVQAELTYGNESIPLSSEVNNFWVLPNLLQMFLGMLLLPLLVFVILKRKNIPRTLAVLRGYANFSGKSYKRSPGKEDLDSKKHDPRTVAEIAHELKQQSAQVLGFPAKDERSRSSEAEIKQLTADTPDAEPVDPPKVIGKSEVQNDDKTTYITQTTASTIVREASPFFDPTQEPAQPKAKKIAVVSHDEVQDAQKDTPQTKTAKPTTKKNSPKKGSPKKTTKKPAAKTKAAPKKSAVKKTTSKTVKKTSAKKAPAKKTTAKKAVPKKATKKKSAPTKKATKK